MNWDTPAAAPAAEESWNDAPAPAEFANGDGDAFTGIAPEQISKHEGGTGGNDYNCRNCGEAGHFSKDCPEPQQGGGLTGECFNCGQVGHNKADCTNERVEREFTGNCRLCDEVGHRASDCPTAPPKMCPRCQEMGHNSSDCPNAYNLYGDDVENLSPDVAWEGLLRADQEGDMDDFKKAFFAYTKSAPDMTLETLQESFRETNLGTWLVAKQQEVAATHTIVNLQGKADCECTISFQYGLTPRRAKMAESWPKTAEENLKRLENAGFPMDRMVPLCHNCGELGHTSKKCPEDKREVDKPKIACSNCKEDGHYIRDCPLAREDRNACRNCKQSGHNAKECPEPRSAENVECRKCNQMGHFSRDCPDAPKMECRNCGQEGHRAAECTEERKITCRNCNGEGHMSRECTEPKNYANMQCRNCDEMGHSSRECPLPKDWSKFQCRNCGEMGHGAARCQAPPKEEGGGFENPIGFSNPEAGSGGGASGGWESGAADAGASTGGGDGGWGVAEAPAATAGGW